MRSRFGALSRNRRRVTALIVALGAFALGTARAAGPDVLPFVVSNDSGRPETLFLYTVGVDIASGRLGSVDQGGTFTPWPAGANPPVPAPDVAIAGPAPGGEIALGVPKGFSGRMYLSFGDRLDFRLTPDGLVQPAPWIPSDPNADTLMDWTEFTYVDAGLYINSSQVDMFAVPHAVEVSDADGRVLRTGQLVANGRENVIAAVRSQPGWERSVITRDDGTVLRVLSAGKATDAGLLDPGYLDPYIDRAWGAYASRYLTVVPFADRPDVRFTGRTVGDTLRFTDVSGQEVAAFDKPTTSDVWGCDGALLAPNDAVVGPIARTLCAALHRSTLGVLDIQPDGGPADFYRGERTNFYSKFVHENMADGRAYGFAFDDVQAQESLVTTGNPVAARIALTPFVGGTTPDAGSPPPPDGPGTPSPPTVEPPPVGPPTAEPPPVEPPPVEPPTAEPPTVEPPPVVPPTGDPLPTSNTPDFGPNVVVFDPSSPDVQARVDEAFYRHLLAPDEVGQFGDQRYTFLFEPGAYDVFANIGYYTTLAGLGRNPDDVTITRNINVDAGWNLGDEANATQNFWRSVENLSVAPESGLTRWAPSQAAPMRRVHIKGALTMGPSNQDFGQGWSSGGYIADSRVDGEVTSGSQQQWYTRSSDLGSWLGGNWNMVFSGVNGAPPADAVHPVLPTTPITREKPYLYIEESGDYRVFVPDLQRDAVGATWPDTPGTSVPLDRFYVTRPGDSAATMNRALEQGLNLFLTPGVYELSETVNVTRPGTIVFGLGYPTIVPVAGQTAMRVADADGIKVNGILFDAGARNSPTLLSVGERGASADHAADPILIQDVYFRIGGPRAGKATTSLEVNSDDTVIDHVWAWRGDHGAGIGWDRNTADFGVIVNGDDVLATGLLVEHYQNHQVLWNGERGRTIFFQNEMPYDPPSQEAWQSPTGLGFAAYKVADGVREHELWGGGAYAYFNVDPSIRASRGFEVPSTPGVRLNEVYTVSLGDVGTIEHVVNDTGGPVPNPEGDTVPSRVRVYP